LPSGVVSQRVSVEEPAWAALTGILMVVWVPAATSTMLLYFPIVTWSPAAALAHSLTRIARESRLLTDTATGPDLPPSVTRPWSTRLTLWLTTPDGKPLPDSTARLTVEATNFGSMAIVIIGIALGVFVLTAAARAVRSGRGRASEEPPEPAETAAGDPTGPDLASAGAEADSVEPERGHPTGMKEPDEHASIPGRAESR
jgi:hypothetical protein